MSCGAVSEIVKLGGCVTRGPEGPQGETGPQGPIGPQGPTAEPFENKVADVSSIAADGDWTIASNHIHFQYDGTVYKIMLTV